MLREKNVGPRTFRRNSDDRKIARKNSRKYGIRNTSRIGQGQPVLSTQVQDAPGLFQHPRRFLSHCVQNLNTRDSINIIFCLNCLVKEWWVLDQCFSNFDAHMNHLSIWTRFPCPFFFLHLHFFSFASQNFTLFWRRVLRSFITEEIKCILRKANFEFDLATKALPSDCSVHGTQGQPWILGLCNHHVSSVDISSGILQQGRIGQQETLYKNDLLRSSSLLQLPEVKECTLLLLEESKAQGPFWTLEREGFCSRSPDMAKLLW